MSKVTLNEAQQAVLYEILNVTGLALTELEADYGTDSIESIVQREPTLNEINVSRVAHQLFSLLGGH
jgi:hypothetical protein